MECLPCNTVSEIINKFADKALLIFIVYVITYYANHFVVYKFPR